MFWQARLFALYMFLFQAGYILSFSTLGYPVCQWVQYCPHWPHQSFSSRSVAQDAAGRQRSPGKQHWVLCSWLQSQTSCGAHSPASSIPDGQHSSPHAGEQCSHPVWHGDAVTGQLELSEKKKKKPGGTRFIVALGMAVAVRQKLQKHSHGMKRVAIPTHSAETDF